MELDEYQTQAHKTASYNEKKTFPVLFKYAFNNENERLEEIPLYPYLKVVTESAEMSEDIIKIAFREDKQYIEDEKLIKEIGDILWYVAEMSSALGISLNYVAQENIKKLKDRQERGVIKGGGDNR